MESKFQYFCLVRQTSGKQAFALTMLGILKIGQCAGCPGFRVLVYVCFIVFICLSPLPRRPITAD